MSTVNMCLAEIHQVIPEELIEEAFVTPYRQDYYRPASADARIITEIFEKRVIPDLSLEYAHQVTIPLESCQIERINVSDYVVVIPPNVLQNRKILSVLGVNTVNIYNNSFFGSDGLAAGVSSVMAAGAKMAAGNSSIPPNYLEKTEVISPNSFIIKRAPYLNTNCTIDVLVEHDSKLNTIDRTAIAYVKELSLLACKAYIYKKLKIRVNRAMLDGGSELSAFSEWLDTYADAEELYQEKKRDASRILWQADEDQNWRLWRLTMGNLV